ncbi:hypothetical protein AOE57_00575 [Candidatus Riesia pediculicola]|nr:hypothetical protein AOE57_00575 [Candidatus Riesia pediculicola]
MLSFLNFFVFFLRSFFYLFTLIKKLISFFLNFLFLIILIFIFLLYLENKGFNKSDFGALLLDLNGIILDHVPSESFLTSNNFNQKLFFSQDEIIRKNSLFEIIHSIREAAKDRKIKGMVLKLDHLIDADQPSLRYIGKCLKEFKKAGKPIFSVGENYSQLQYYLSSFADKIYISNYGKIDIHGISNYRMYYKDFLEKLKIKSHIFRAGKYKSAVEPFMRNNMSHESKENHFSCLRKLWKDYLKTVSENRNIEINDVFPEINSMIKKIKSNRGNITKYLMDQKLVDYVIEKTNPEEKFIEKFGLSRDDNQYNRISIYEYKNDSTRRNDKFLGKRNDFPSNIAVIFVQGMISGGNEENYENSSIANSENIVKKIRQAESDPNIRSLILRINSPGGTVSDSEKIRNALKSFRKNKKFVVVSMGGMATSGGYWISTESDRVIADQTTITGSIGVFGVVNTFESSLEDIGIRCDGISTTPLSQGPIEYTGINPYLSEILKISVDHNYEKFLKYVSLSRKKNIQDVRTIANGRIWIGSEAFKVGLIDQLGDFDDAIEAAMKISNIEHPSLEWMFSDTSLMENLIDLFSSNIKNLFISTIILSQKKETLELMRYGYNPYDKYITNFNDCYAICLHCNISYK